MASGFGSHRRCRCEMRVGGRGRQRPRGDVKFELQRNHRPAAPRAPHHERRDESCAPIGAAPAGTAPIGAMPSGAACGSAVAWHGCAVGPRRAAPPPLLRAASSYAPRRPRCTTANSASESTPSPSRSPRRNIDCTLRSLAASLPCRRRSACSHAAKSAGARPSLPSPAHLANACRECSTSASERLSEDTSTPAAVRTSSAQPVPSVRRTRLATARGRPDSSSLAAAPPIGTAAGRAPSARAASLERRPAVRLLVLPAPRRRSVAAADAASASCSSLCARASAARDFSSAACAATSPPCAAACAGAPPRAELAEEGAPPPPPFSDSRACLRSCAIASARAIVRR
eukprot:6694185-Prymnesium_polylepis.1